MAEKTESGTNFTRRVLIAVAVVCLVVLGLALVYFVFDICKQGDALPENDWVNK